MSLTINDRVALVTGSSTGLGKAIAFALAGAGAKVAINYYNNEGRARRTFDEFRQAGHEGMLVRGDVASEEGVGATCSAVEAELGPIDILVANATPAQLQLPIEKYTWQHYQTMIDFFVKSPYLLTRRCISHMKKQRWGRIVNIGSEVFARGVPCFSAYVSAKGGQAGFTRSMASELAAAGITVNLVSPGWIPVERHEQDPKELKDAYIALVPAARWGSPADIASAVLYYASEEAGFVTGQDFAVNGGLTVG